MARVYQLQKWDVGRLTVTDINAVFVDAKQCGVYQTGK